VLSALGAFAAFALEREAPCLLVVSVLSSDPVPTGDPVVRNTSITAFFFESIPHSDRALGRSSTERALPPHFSQASWRRLLLPLLSPGVAANRIGPLSKDLLRWSPFGRADEVCPPPPLLDGTPQLTRMYNITLPMGDALSQACREETLLFLRLRSPGFSPPIYARTAPFSAFEV